MGREGLDTSSSTSRRSIADGSFYFNTWNIKSNITTSKCSTSIFKGGDIGGSGRHERYIYTSGFTQREVASRVRSKMAISTKPTPDFLESLLILPPDCFFLKDNRIYKGTPFITARQTTWNMAPGPAQHLVQHV